MDAGGGGGVSLGFSFGFDLCSEGVVPVVSVDDDGSDVEVVEAVDVADVAGADCVASLCCVSVRGVWVMTMRGSAGRGVRVRGDVAVTGAAVPEESVG